MQRVNNGATSQAGRRAQERKEIQVHEHGLPTAALAVAVAVLLKLLF